MINSNGMNKQGKYANLKVLVAQLGPRMYYGVPKILHRIGMLEQLHTDFYVAKWPWHLLYSNTFSALLPKPAKILSARKTNLPPDKVTAFQAFGIQYIYRLIRSRNATDTWRINLWAGKKFNELIIKRGIGQCNCIYGFKGASLNLFEPAAKLGIKRVLEQCASPKLVEHDIVREEYYRWLGWEEPTSPEGIKAFAEIEAMEWELADLIICPSSFVNNGLERLGVPNHKRRVVPYGVDLERRILPRQKKSKPLRVLFVGQVRLLKGIPYLIDAMRQFTSREAICRVVGPIMVSAQKLAAYTPDNVSLVGSVARKDIGAQYGWADVFCLPTLCEGSATVIYEALACGLPVITTPNSGSIIPEGTEHFLVPIRSPDAIADALRRIAKRKYPLTGAAVTKNLQKTVSFDSYANRLIDALQNIR
jgi:glycosyltransferase involved in cell wall biosynthesis